MIPFEPTAHANCYFGDDPGTDRQVELILDELRTFIDPETIDGKVGLAGSWRKTLVSAGDIRRSYERFLRMREMVDRLDQQQPRWGDDACDGTAPSSSSRSRPRSIDRGVSDDGSLLSADGVIHPVSLRIRAQEGDVLHANDGDIRDMSYRIVPVPDRDF